MNSGDILLQFWLGLITQLVAILFSWWLNRRQ